MEDIDVRIILRKLLRNWYWFLLSMLVTLTLAVVYLATTEKKYLVEASIQLKDQSLSDKGNSQEKFLSGFELLDSDPEIEDEIGILTSYSMISGSLKELGFEIAYHQYPAMLGTLGKMFSEELYPAPFKLQLNPDAWQLTYQPVDITFPDSKHYRVKISAKKQPRYLLHPKTQEIVEKVFAIELDTVLSIQDPLRLPYLNISIDTVDSLALDLDQAYYVTLSSLNDVTEHYHKKLFYGQISDKSNIVKLSLQSATPQKDIVFLKMLSSMYINNDLKKKNLLGEKTIEFIDFQLQGVADSLRGAENKLQAFRSRSNVVNVELTSKTLNEQLFALEETREQLLVQNKYYQYMSDYLASNDDVSDVVAPSSVGIHDELLNSLLIQLSKLNEEKINKSFSSSKQSPVIQVLDRKISSTKQALIENISNLIGANKIGLQESNRRVAELQQTISRLPENERNLTDINRRFTFNDNIYNYLLQKKAEAGIAIASNIPDKTIVDPPHMIGKEPVAPNKAFVMLVALLAGLIVPVGFIFSRDFFRPKVETKDQLLSWTNIPLIDQISYVKGDEKSNQYAGDGYLAHAFRYIRQHIGFLQVSENIKVVGITSSTSGEGKTFCATHLALSFARVGKKTLLIEADLHLPKLSGYFKVKTSPGISDCLLGGSKLLVQKTEVENLDLVAAGTPVENASDLLNHTSLDLLVSTLREKYDIIIFDTPPVGLVADYLILSKYFDYTLLVVRHEFSGKEQVQRLDKLVRDHHLNAGIVYNGSVAESTYKGYYKKVAKRSKQ
ncbi:tyrosine-protein kinase [Cesiribacter sp. SM1]|uniref:GumC family protein n=1 Tax=Cesiribacter sp. SM1 TaxID=2861196 RepID=UPI001CD29FA9|nr:tyrosine-protein kinase [Cesiribacter sp. SM1]